MWRLLANSLTLTCVPSHSYPSRKANGNANEVSTCFNGKTNPYAPLCQFSPETTKSQGRTVCQILNRVQSLHHSSFELTFLNWKPK